MNTLSIVLHKVDDGYYTIHAHGRLYIAFKAATRRWAVYSVSMRKPLVRGYSTRGEMEFLDEVEGLEKARQYVGDLHAEDALSVLGLGQASRDDGERGPSM